MDDRPVAILFAESDQEAGRVLAHFLSRWGKLLEVDSVAEGRLAIAREQPEVLVVDAELRDGDGLELVATVRERVPWAQVLVISSPEQSWRMSAFISSGANDVITRPFDIGMLAPRIMRLKEALTVRREEFDRLRQLEARVRHVDGISMLGTLTATIVHEIASPLSAVLTNAKLVEAALSKPSRNLEETATTIQAVQDILWAGQLIQEFVARVRGFSRRVDPVFVNESLAKVAETARLCLQQKIMFSRVAVAWPPTIKAPVARHVPTRLAEALINAVANAIEASGAGGHVDIRYEQSADWVALIVEDDGPGLGMEMVEKVKEPFFTTKPDGTGVGISVMEDVMREHGGRVVFGAGLRGRGLGVRLELPRG